MSEQHIMSLMNIYHPLHHIQQHCQIFKQHHMSRMWCQTLEFHQSLHNDDKTYILENSINPETTVETTEIGTSEPERTTIQQETSMHVSVLVKLSHIFFPLYFERKR